MNKDREQLIMSLRTYTPGLCVQHGSAYAERLMKAAADMLEGDEQPGARVGWVQVKVNYTYPFHAWWGNLRQSKGEVLVRAREVLLSRDDIDAVYAITAIAYNKCRDMAGFHELAKPALILISQEKS